MIITPIWFLFLVLFSGIATEMSVWEGVVVSPLDTAYEKPTEEKEDMDKDGLDVECHDEVTMDTQS